MRLIDSHSHIQEKEFDARRTEVLARMRDAGVGTIVVGCDYESSTRAVELAQHQENVWACIGMHPVDTQTVFQKSDFTGLVGAKKANGMPAVVAVGECGLDYFRLDFSRPDLVHEEKTRQKVSFKNQIEWALQLDLPLMLHVRPSKGTTDAHDDALALLREYATSRGDEIGTHRLRGTSHFFTSTVAVAEQYLTLGFHISLPGVVTFARDLESVVRSVPLERMLLESDSPYAAPAPLRGCQNEPAFIVHTAGHVAAVLGISVDEVVRYTTENATTLFNIS